MLHAAEIVYPYHPVWEFRNEVPAGSLALRESWPEWAQESAANVSGIDAVRRIGAQATREVYFLGMPYLEEQVRPRVSMSTNEDGEYYIDGPAKVTLVKDPDCAVMRSLINRVALADAGVEPVDERCWSGWFLHPQTGRLQCVTTSDMAKCFMYGPNLGYVAAFDIGNLPTDISTTTDPKRPREISLQRPDGDDFLLKPDAIVPLNGGIALTIEMLVLAEKDISRREAMDAYAQLSALPAVPDVVRLRSGRSVRVKSFWDFYGLKDAYA